MAAMAAPSTEALFERFVLAAETMCGEGRSAQMTFADANVFLSHMACSSLPLSADAGQEEAHGRDAVVLEAAGGDRHGGAARHAATAASADPTGFSTDIVPANEAVAQWKKSLQVCMHALQLFCDGGEQHQHQHQPHASSEHGESIKTCVALVALHVLRRVLPALLKVEVEEEQDLMRKAAHSGQAALALPDMMTRRYRRGGTGQTSTLLDSVLTNMQQVLEDVVSRLLLCVGCPRTAPENQVLRQLSRLLAALCAVTAWEGTSMVTAICEKCSTAIVLSQRQYFQQDEQAAATAAAYFISDFLLNVPIEACALSKVVGSDNDRLRTGVQAVLRERQVVWTMFASCLDIQQPHLSCITVDAMRGWAECTLFQPIAGPDIWTLYADNAWMTWVDLCTPLNTAATDPAAAAAPAVTAAGAADGAASQSSILDRALDIFHNAVEHIVHTCSQRDPQQQPSDIGDPEDDPTVNLIESIASLISECLEVQSPQEALLDARSASAAASPEEGQLFAHVVHNILRTSFQFLASAHTLTTRTPCCLGGEDSVHTMATGSALETAALRSVAHVIACMVSNHAPALACTEGMYVEIREQFLLEIAPDGHGGILLEQIPSIAASATLPPEQQERLDALMFAEEMPPSLFLLAQCLHLLCRAVSCQDHVIMSNIYEVVHFIPRNYSARLPLSYLLGLQVHLVANLLLNLNCSSVIREAVQQEQELAAAHDWLCEAAFQPTRGAHASATNTLAPMPLEVEDLTAAIVEYRRGVKDILSEWCTWAAEVEWENQNEPVQLLLIEFSPVKLVADRIALLAEQCAILEQEEEQSQQQQQQQHGHEQEQMKLQETHFVCAIEACVFVLGALAQGLNDKYLELEDEDEDDDDEDEDDDDDEEAGGAGIDGGGSQRTGFGASGAGGGGRAHPGFVPASSLALHHNGGADPLSGRLPLPSSNQLGQAAPLRESTPHSRSQHLSTTSDISSAGQFRSPRHNAKKHPRLVEPSDHDPTGEKQLWSHILRHLPQLTLQRMCTEVPLLHCSMCSFWTEVAWGYRKLFPHPLVVLALQSALQMQQAPWSIVQRAGCTVLRTLVLEAGSAIAAAVVRDPEYENLYSWFAEVHERTHWLTIPCQVSVSEETVRQADAAGLHEMVAEMDLWRADYMPFARHFFFAWASVAVVTVDASQDATALQAVVEPQQALIVQYATAAVESFFEWLQEGSSSSSSSASSTEMAASACVGGQALANPGCDVALRFRLYLVALECVMGCVGSTARAFRGQATAAVAATSVLVTCLQTIDRLLLVGAHGDALGMRVLMFSSAWRHEALRCLSSLVECTTTLVHVHEVRSSLGEEELVVLGGALWRAVALCPDHITMSALYIFLEVLAESRGLPQSTASDADRWSSSSPTFENLSDRLCLTGLRVLWAGCQVGLSQCVWAGEDQTTGQPMTHPASVPAIPNSPLSEEGGAADCLVSTVALMRRGFVQVPDVMFKLWPLPPDEAVLCEYTDCNSSVDDDSAPVPIPCAYPLASVALWTAVSLSSSGPTPPCSLAALSVEVCSRIVYHWELSGEYTAGARAVQQHKHQRRRALTHTGIEVGSTAQPIAAVSSLLCALRDALESTPQNRPAAGWTMPGDLAEQHKEHIAPALMNLFAFLLQGACGALAHGPGYLAEKSEHIAKLFVSILHRRRSTPGAQAVRLGGNFGAGSGDGGQGAAGRQGSQRTRHVRRKSFPPGSGTGVSAIGGSAGVFGLLGDRAPSALSDGDDDGSARGPTYYQQLLTTVLVATDYFVVDKLGLEPAQWVARELCACDTMDRFSRILSELALVAAGKKTAMEFEVLSQPPSALSAGGRRTGAGGGVGRIGGGDGAGTVGGALDGVHIAANLASPDFVHI